MGLTRDTLKNVDRSAEGKSGIRIALAGNPNVGKSTVFNALTGMHQHTGNWSGKTVGCATGECRGGEEIWQITDLPGCYSLLSRSPEEEAARDFLMREDIALTVVVCDASALERNLNLVLQIMELSQRTLLCLNLMDEAEGRGIRIDTDGLSRTLGIPVVPLCARRSRDIRRLKREISTALRREEDAPYPVPYPDSITEMRASVARAFSELSPRHAAFFAMRVLDGSAQRDSLPSEMREQLCTFHASYPPEEISDTVATTLVREAERIGRASVRTPDRSDRRERAIDRILTGRLTAFPIMLLMLFFILWITVVGANIPSAALSSWLISFEQPLFRALSAIGVPDFLCEMAVCGMYRVLAWVVSVMLPPMAIFFPLFTLLEDLGYLPRIAYNLDRCFACCSTCGKQALTMCMGFGCNAAGVVGCRIIDSPRERLIAILTNSFVPCNGRFPLLIAVITMFLAKTGNSLSGALMLSAAVVFSVGVTMAVSALLARSCLRGLPSAFTLELPPFRRPKIVSILLRSLIDRTLFVLGRAAAVAAPAGLLIWILANVEAGGMSLFAHLQTALDPIGHALGMDGVILLAFILGFPANETVIPIMIMGYLSAGTLVEYESLASLRMLLTENGWTPLTAVCVMLFSLMHWPCSTTLWTVYKETHSVRYTTAALVLPTLCGASACALITLIGNLFA